MSYFDMYKSRLNATGTNSANSIINSTKQTINNNFDISPFSISILIDDMEFRVILTHDSKSKNKKLLLKPETRINIGSSVHIEDDFYLVMDFLGEGIYEIYPTATLKQCNSFFPAITDKTKVLMRDDQGNVIRDKFGDPVYQWVGGEEFLVPCIVESSIKDREKNSQLNLPDGRIVITMKYQPISNVKDNAEFMMYDNTYKIANVDKTKVINEVGLMTVTADIVPSEVIS